MRIAIATTDGVLVDQHFGRAKKFAIYEVSEGKKVFVEERSCQNYCKHSECIPHDFDTDRFSQVLPVLKDCEKVYVALIGDKPAEKLKENNIEAVVYDGPIENI